MAITDSIVAFYNHLLENDKDNKDNWMLHKNGMCNSISRNPDECISVWICVKLNYVEVVLLVEAKTADQAVIYSKDVSDYLLENNITDFKRMDSTVDNIKYRSKRRSRWVKSHEWLESPIECFDWAISNYYNCIKMLKDI